MRPQEVSVANTKGKETEKKKNKKQKNGNRPEEEMGGKKDQTPSLCPAVSVSLLEKKEGGWRDLA